MLKRTLKIRRILGALVLTQFVLLNGLIQLHNSVHPSDHGRHLSVHVSWQHGPAFPSVSLKTAAVQNSGHSLCAICYLCSSNQVLPVAGIRTQQDCTATFVSIIQSQRPTSGAPDTPSGRSPPSAA